MKRALTGVFLVWAASAQQRAYDAVSVKQNRTASNGKGGPSIKNGGAISMRNVPVRSLIATAYGVAGYQLSKSPAGFHLVVDKGGNRLKVSEAKAIGFSIQSMEELRGPADTPMLARVLTAILHAPVEDHTGLTGNYDMEVKWTPDNGASTSAVADQVPTSSWH